LWAACSAARIGLKEIIGDNRWGNDGQLAGPPPDARLWQVRSLREPQQIEQLAAKLGPDAKTDTLFLAAATVPPPALNSQLIAAAAGSVKAVVEGIPEKYKDQIGAGLAEALAKQGLYSDPQAKVKLEFKIFPEADGQTVGKDIPKDQLTPAMKEHLKTFPHDKWVQSGILRAPPRFATDGAKKEDRSINLFLPANNIHGSRVSGGSLDRRGGFLGRGAVAQRAHVRPKLLPLLAFLIGNPGQRRVVADAG
jgi:hypothetical protein